MDPNEVKNNSNQLRHNSLVAIIMCGTVIVCCLLFRHTTTIHSPVTVYDCSKLTDKEEVDKAKAFTECQTIWHNERGDCYKAIEVIFCKPTKLTCKCSKEKKK